MKQAAAMQQSMTASGASPEQTAQMAAAMAQVQQMMSGDGGGAPVQAEAHAEKAAPEQVLTVDALMRGHVQFINRDGKSTTMIIFNRETGEELLKKQFTDGVIDEYVSFGRYKLPLEQIGLFIKDISGEILADLTPKLDS